MNNLRLQVAFFTVLVVVAVFLNYEIFRPYLTPLFLAIVVSVVMRPVYNHIFVSLRGKATLAALLSLVVVMFLVVLPVGFIAVFFVNDAQGLYRDIVSGKFNLGSINTALAPIESYVQTYVPDFTINIIGYVKQALVSIIGNFGFIFSSAVLVCANLFIMLLAIFYFLRDGERLKKEIVLLSPLDDKYDESIINRLGSAISSVVRGTLFVCLLQGVASFIGFIIFGIPNAVLLATAVTLSAIIPAVGTSIVFFPLIGYLLLTGGVFQAIAVAIWATLAVGLIDNILSPILIERGLRIHPFLILLSALGGIAYYGPIGFLVGPVVLALLFALLDIYPMLFERKIRD